MDKERTNFWLDNSAYVNLLAFILFGVVDIFNVIPKILIPIVLVICLINMGLIAHGLYGYKKSDHSPDPYKKVRNAGIRMMALAVGIIAVASVKLTVIWS